MKEIKLTRGKVLLIDDEDFDWLSQHKWSYNGRYVSGRVDGVNLKVHRFILNAPDGMEVDHINLNVCDNQRSNLRLVNRSQNMINVGKRSNNKAGYKGVSASTGNYRNPWAACLGYNNKILHLGYFKTPRQAAMAYDMAARDLFGEYAKLNFPDGIHGQ